MKSATIMIALAGLLAACGAEGPPRAPETPPPGISISGEARMGVSGRL